MALPIISNVGKATTNYATKKSSGLKKAIKKNIAPTRALKYIGRQVGNVIAKENPDLASAFSAIKDEFSEFTKGFKKDKTKKVPTVIPAPANNNNPNGNTGDTSLILSVLQKHTEFLKNIFAELQTMTELFSQVHKLSELQLDMTRRTYQDTHKNNKHKKFNQQKKKGQSGFKPNMPGIPGTPPKKEEDGFIKRLLSAMGFGLLAKGILSLGAGVSGIIAAITGIGSLILGLAPAIIGGLGSLLTGLMGKLGMDIPSTPKNTPQAKPISAKAKTGSKPKSRTPQPRDAKGRFTKAQPKKSIAKKMLKSGGKQLGRVAKAGSRLLLNPTTLVAGTAGAIGGAAGYYGLEGLSNGIDKLTGKQDSIGSVLLSIQEKLSGIQATSFKENEQPKTVLKPVAPKNDMNKFMSLKSTTEKLERFETESKATNIINNNNKHSKESSSGSQHINVNNNSTNVITSLLKTRNDAAWSDALLTGKIKY